MKLLQISYYSPVHILTVDPVKVAMVAGKKFLVITTIVCVRDATAGNVSIQRDHQPASRIECRRSKHQLSRPLAVNDVASACKVGKEHKQYRPCNSLNELTSISQSKITYHNKNHNDGCITTYRAARGDAVGNVSITGAKSRTPMHA